MNRSWQSLQSLGASSLRKRLMLLVSAASLITLGLATLFSYQRARHEIQEMMDLRMAKTAQLILAQASHGKLSLAELPVDITVMPPLGANGLVEYQIGTSDGTILVKSAISPDTSIPRPLGFGIITEQGNTWRTLVLESPDRQLRVQVAESIPKRNREALEIATRTVRPLAFMLPFLLIAIYFAVRRGLKPLDNLATEVAVRTPDNLSPLGTRSVPQEAQPLALAINQLFFRLGQTLANERRFTADAAHELRTPLAAAKIQAQVALLSKDADRTHALTQTLAGLERASRLVDQLLRLARLDPLSRLPDPQNFRLSPLIETTIASLIDTRPEASIDFAPHVKNDEISGDPALIEIALRNLIDNALRYASQEEMPATITVTLTEDAHQITVSILDNGPGVSPSELPRLSERFYRGTAANAEGSGLGLTIVSRIAELHRAQFSFDNRQANGEITGFESRLVFMR